MKKHWRTVSKNSLFIFSISFIVGCLFTSCEKRLEKDFHNGTFAFSLPDTIVYYNYNSVINITYDQLGEGTNFHFYGEQYDTLTYWHFEADFWNSGIYKPNVQYIEGELSTENICQGNLNASGGTLGFYIFEDDVILTFDQVDETRVKGNFTGEFYHLSHLYPVTCYFNFTP